MAWETRQRGGGYYYRKVRKDGRVFSVYEGGGLGGRLAERRDAEERATRQKSLRELRAQLAEQDAIDAKLDAAWLIVQGAARGALEAAGYHQHKRQWRLKRDAKADG